MAVDCTAIKFRLLCNQVDCRMIKLRLQCSQVDCRAIKFRLLCNPVDCKTIKFRLSCNLSAIKICFLQPCNLAAIFPQSCCNHAAIKNFCKGYL